MKSKKSNRAKNGFLRKTSTDSKETASVILINYTSAPIRKERLNPTSKARREASQNMFMEKGGMPDRVKSFRKISSREDRPRARPWFVEPIRSGLRRIKNLMQSGWTRAETGLAGRENGIRF